MGAENDRTGTRRVGRTEYAQIIDRIEDAYPKASLMYARIVARLLDAPDRSLSLSDLSEAIGRGRDSTAVQAAAIRLEQLGLVRRELVGAQNGGRYMSVQLVRAPRGG